jgi:general secretion pathway protein H
LPRVRNVQRRVVQLAFARPFSYSARSSRGFTLIELLVVVFIIGVIAYAAQLSVNVLGRDSQVEDEARRLWAVLRQTREEAELQGINIGAYFAAEEYEFLRLDVLNNVWVPISGDRLHASRKLPDDLRFRIWLDGREIVLKPQLPEREDEEKRELTEEERKEAELPRALRTVKPEDIKRTQQHPPQVVVLSSGEVMPFELHIERERQPALWRLVATAENDLRVEQRAKSSENWTIIEQTNPPPDEQEAKANARR